MKDNACIQVINRRTYEQVAIWHGKTDPMTFAEELAKVGMFYNQAPVTTEIEGPGWATISRLISLEYPRIWSQRQANKVPGTMSESLGWSSTHKSKEWAIGWLIKLLVDRDITIHDRRTYDEMRNYITLTKGGFGPADEAHGHDDTVTSLAICCICSSTDGPVAAYAGQDRLAEILEPEPVWSDWALGDTAEVS